MPATVPERLFALYSFLLSRERPVTKDRIREGIEAYRRAGSDAAFERTFERDKAALRSLGMRLATTQDFGETVYQIERENLWLTNDEFTPAERLTLGIAARLWSDPSYARDVEQAVRRLGYGESDVVGSGGLEHLTPRLSSGGEQLETILGALAQGAEMTFDYRASTSLVSVPRRLRPWGVGQRFGHWYVSGWDADRKAFRNFRLSRMTGISTKDSDLPRAPREFSMSKALESVSEAPAPSVQLEFPSGALPVVLDWSEAGTGVRIHSEAFPAGNGSTLMSAEATVPDVHELVRCLAELGSGVALGIPRAQGLDAEGIQQAVDRAVATAMSLQDDVSALVASDTARIVEPKRARNRESNDRRFVRLVDLASFLGSHPGCGTREIARHLGVSAGQVRQDLEAIANAGEELLGSAYMRIDAYEDEVFVQLPEELEQPLNLAPDQIIRLLLAVQMLEQISHQHAQTASDISRKLVRMANGAGVSVDQFSIRLEPHLAEIVDKLRQAASERQAVSMTYRSRGQASATERKVLPLDVYSSGNTWYLGAESLEHRQVRTYRMEAIRDVRPLHAPAAQLSMGAEINEHSEPSRTTVWVADRARALAAALGGEVVGHVDVPRHAECEGQQVSGQLLEVSVIDWFGLYRLMLHHAGSMALWQSASWQTDWADTARRRGIDIGDSR
ncbi:helix-turn-helix transcriptional regulator [Rothia uropygioeca]|uniref:helix-turn-helix transcriptional regulator n=1 Tax=Kocuria sp. 257 TaxID=2021970 RepID=UPI0010121635|nr:WYL domain-containing protein [Kocuria sp. 257]